jgi:sulfite reductase (ferredoxin)
MSAEHQPTGSAVGAAAPKPIKSGVEVVKEASQHLRGGIALELAKDSSGFSDADKNLLKFHGTYQQDDRDARKARRGDGLGKHHIFMVRCKIPGGRMTAEQYLALDHLADLYGNKTLRFTSRQGVQFHGVLKANLKSTIAGINECLLTTLGACGDVERNVMACPAPHHHDGVHAELQATAARVAAHFAPRTGAYHEIWLDGKALNGHPNGPWNAAARGAREEEPLYGQAYLPRKFKTGLALPEDNCIDVYGQDLGLLAIVEGHQIVGYNVLVGGSMGVTHGNPNTFPMLARPICYVAAADVLRAAESVIQLFRDHGNRADRKRARIKYVVHDWGVERFREVLAGYLGYMPDHPRPVQVSGYDLHHGWHPQGDGRWFYGLSVENGRVKDEGPFFLRTAVRTVVERFKPEVRLTPMQDVLFCGLPGNALPVVEGILGDHGVLRPERLSNVQRYSMACPAIPTCGLAISESERAMPGIIDELETVLKALGLENETISVRMTGCPNGCARPYQSDIGIVGRSGDKYTLYVGGHVLGHRLNYVLRDLMPRRDLVRFLRALLVLYKHGREPGEGFGDYCQRLGQEKVQALLSDYQL